MKRTLDDLCTMAGVNGVFVCTDEGSLIEFSAPRMYDAETFSHAATAVARAAESVSVQHSDWETLVAHFNDGRLIFSRMDQYILCVISDQGTNVPFLNVAIKVAKNKIKRRLEGAGSSVNSSVNSSFAEGRFSSQFSSEPHGSSAPESEGIQKNFDLHPPSGFSGCWNVMDSETNNKIVSAHYVDGIKNDEETRWYADSGRKMSVHHFKNGVLNGLSMKWQNSKSQNLLMKGFYRDGKPWSGEFIAKNSTEVDDRLDVDESNSSAFLLVFKKGKLLKKITKSKGR